MGRLSLLLPEFVTSVTELGCCPGPFRRRLGARSWALSRCPRPGRGGLVRPSGAHPSVPGWEHRDDQAPEQVVPAELVAPTSQEQFSRVLGDLSMDGANTRFIVRSRVSRAPVTWRRTSTGTVTPSPVGGSIKSSRSGQDPVRKAEPLYRTRSPVPVRGELSVSTHPCVLPKWTTHRGPCASVQDAA